MITDERDYDFDDNVISEEDENILSTGDNNDTIVYNSQYNTISSKKNILNANGIMKEKRLSNLNDPEIQKKLSTEGLGYVDSKSESMEEHREYLDIVPVDDHVKLSFNHPNQQKKP